MKKLKKFNLLCNENIKSEKIRLISETKEQMGIVSVVDALTLAKSKNLDLVQMSSHSNPPVCRIIEYRKFVFQQSKKKEQHKKKQKNLSIKEIKIRPCTDIGDYNIKLRHIKKFINNGNKIRIYVRFKGREITHQNIGYKMIQRIENDIKDFVKIESVPKMDGRNLLMTVAPIK